MRQSTLQSAGGWRKPSGVRDRPEHRRFTCALLRTRPAFFERGRMTYTQLETVYLERIRARLADLREYLSGVTLSENSHLPEFFAALAKIKAIQGNINNDLSFLACLLAKRYLEK